MALRLESSSAGSYARPFVFLATIMLLTQAFYLQRMAGLNASAARGNKQEQTDKPTVQQEKVAIAKSSIRTCSLDTIGTGIPASLFKAQSGEDKTLLNWFSDRCQGTYLEMGGLDGVRFSNSFVFHHGLNWTGILVEASPANFELLQKNRPNEIATVHAGVCDQEQDLHWVTARDGAVGGFYEFAAPGFQKMWWTDDAIKNAQVIQCKRLTTILDETVGSPYHFDFFSLDVEGAELGVLRSIDFTRYSFGIVLVEADGHNHMKNMGVQMILESNGYKFVREMQRSYWFANKNWDQIYQDVIQMNA